MTCGKALPAPLRDAGQHLKYCNKGCYPPKTEKARTTRKAYQPIQNARRQARRNDPDYKANELARDKQSERARLVDPTYRTARTKKTRSYKLKYLFGMTQDQYDTILASQGGCCAVRGCTTSAFGKLTKFFAVDHDHSTGAVRGIVCGRCNTGIGMLGDNIDGVRAALRYLERHEANLISHPLIKATSEEVLH